MYSLKDICKIIEELKNCSSTNGKKFILEKNKDNELLKKVLLYTYNPHLKYGVSEKFLNDLQFDGEDCQSENLFELLDILAKSNINDNLRNRIRRHINYYSVEEVRELVKNIIGKNLKCNINIKLINKVWKDLIPTSDGTRKISPMLGSKIDFDKTPNEIMYVTQKYDGSRCLIFIEDNKVELFSRQGKKIEGCKQIEEDVLKLGLDNVMLDGEILAINVDYENVYKETMKRLNNKKENKVGLYYMAYDILDKDEYSNLKGKIKYAERRNKLNQLKETKYIKIAPLLAMTNDMNIILNILDEYRSKGAEGLMVNLDRPYDFKRTKTLLKIKVMQTIDLRVIGFEEGTNKYEGKLGAVLVKYKGNIVKVGSGWSDSDREEVWNNQDKYLDKILEIQYFEETTNKDGTFSLRFPIAKNWRFEKDEESYE